MALLNAAVLWFQNSWLWLFSSLRSWRHFVSSSVCVFMAVANMLNADACCWKATTKSKLVCRFASSSWLFLSRSRVRRSSRSIETGTGSILSPAVGTGPLIGPLPWTTPLSVGVSVGASEATECCVMSSSGRDPEAMAVATRHSGIELTLGSSGSAIADVAGAAHGLALGSPDPRLRDLSPSSCDAEVTTWFSGMRSCADDCAGAAASIAGGVMDLLSELFLSVCDLEVAAVCSCRCVIAVAIGSSGMRSRADDFTGAAASIAGGVDLLSELFLSTCNLEVAAVCSRRCVVTEATGFFGTSFGTSNSAFATLRGKETFGFSAQVPWCSDCSRLSSSSLGALLAGTTASSSSIITQSGVSRPESLLDEQSNSFARFTLDFTLTHLTGESSISELDSGLLALEEEGAGAFGSSFFFRNSAASLGGNWQHIQIRWAIISAIWKADRGSCPRIEAIDFRDPFSFRLLLVAFGVQVLVHGPLARRAKSAARAEMSAVLCFDVLGAEVPHHRAPTSNPSAAAALHNNNASHLSNWRATGHCHYQGQLVLIS